MRIFLLLGVLAMIDSCKLPSFQKDESVVLEQPVDLNGSGEKRPEPNNDSGSVAPRSEPKPEPKAEPKVEAEKTVNTVIVHSIDNCVWCIRDKRDVLPGWKAQGWKIVLPNTKDGNEVPVSGQLYPWYEVYDNNGVRKVHIGSLRTWK